MKNINKVNKWVGSLTADWLSKNTFINMSCFIAAVALSVSAMGQGNLVKNSEFEQNTNDTQVITSGQIPPKWNISFKADPNLSLRVTHDTAGGSNGALMAIIPNPRSEDANSGNYGLIIQTHSIQANSKVRVSFDAKSISGSVYLNVKRPWTGHNVNARQKLTSNWEHYVTEFDYVQPGTGILFNFAPNACDDAFGDVVGGSFLIDNIIAEIVPANGGSAANLTPSACAKEGANP